MGWFTNLFPTRRRVQVVLGPVVESMFPVEVIMGVVLKDTQKIKLKAVEVDAHGHETTVSGPFTYTSSDEDVVKVVTEDDGSVWAYSQGEPGSADVTATDDSGTTGTLHVEVVAGDPTGTKLTPDGDPVEIE